MTDINDIRAALNALCDNCDNVQAVCAHYPCEQYIAIEKLYEGCRNCKYQIEPLRACEWLEKVKHQTVYLVCPRWERRDDA